MIGNGAAAALLAGHDPASATEETPARDGANERPTLFEAERLRKASWAFTTRRVPAHQPYRIRHVAIEPKAGDLVLARVDTLGHHRGLQLWSGRKKSLFPGDEIVVVYGNRYASSQFEAVVPKTLGPCALVAGGGVAAKTLSWHSRISSGPTSITPIGLLIGPDGRPANLMDFAVEQFAELVEPCPTTIAMIGTGMDAGKTTAAAFLVRGLTQTGLRVGFAKVTGTGAGGDPWLLRDAGADPVLDFVDAGYVSTFRVSCAEVERILATLVVHLTKSGADALVLEVADGILQLETAALIDSVLFKAIVDGIILTSQDSMGALAGVDWLRNRGLPVLGLGGVLTAAPLQCAEAVEATGLPTYLREDLARPETARSIIASAGFQD